MKTLRTIISVWLCFAASVLHAQTNLWQNSGNVGIGTTNPQAKLQITGAYAMNQYTGVRVVPAPTVNDYQQLDFTHALGGRLSANITGNYANDDILLTTTGFHFRTGNASFDPTEKLTILTDGNVGIGTSSPISKLHIVAENNKTVAIYTPSQAAGITDFAVGGVGFKFSRPQDGSLAQAIYTYDSLGGAKNNLAISSRSDIVFTAGNSGPEASPERMRISETGNVGIGTANPWYQLQVQKTSVATPAIMIGGGYFGGPRLQTYGLDADANAWMGLGTDMSGGPYEHSIYFSDYNGMGFLSFGTYNGSTYSEKMRLTRAGNLGIGTTNPSEKLSVNGKIRAKEVIVETNWSDYVFADDYKLQSLAEVETQIKTNKHLPGVPSAQEVAEKGVSVGDMQAVLLAKIEELTLHQIAQGKAIGFLQSKVQSLEAENGQLKAQLK
jgi:hypothetical protein